MLKQAMNNNKPIFFILLFFLYVTQLTQCKVARRQDADAGTNAGSNLIASDGKKKSDVSTGEDELKSPLVEEKEGECWISLKEENFFEKMDALDEKYRDARGAYARDVDTTHFDKRMLDAMVKTRGVAERTLQRFHGFPNVIPAGLNLGSYCMMRMPGSMLFFYRLKLRNDTRFTVNYIHNDVEQFALTMRLSLNDLHLVGQYERALTSSEDPSRLYYRPNKGEIEFLLKDVKYKVEGRYRLLEDRLHIEHIISEIPPMEILMRYTADTAKDLPLEPAGLRDYLDRMQADLDLWLKDYLNDFLLLYGFEEAQKNDKIQEYENEKAMILNEYADKVIDILNERVKSLGPDLMMPDFLLTAANGMEIKLYDGSVRGFDSMYRRSVATGKRVDKVRYLDADIGFSGLKAEYRYDTFVKTGLPPVAGVFVLNADDINAHMALQLVNYKPATADLHITYLRHGKPESLTIEGPANRIVANFNHLLEHHIITIMSTTLIHHIRSLSSLTRCDPQLPTKNGGHEEQRTESNSPFNTDNHPEYDITTPMKPDDDDKESSQDTDDNKETEMTQNINNDDGPTEPSQYTENNDDETTKSPDDDDDEPTEPSQYTETDDEDTTKSPDDDEPTEPSQYTENDDEDTTKSPDDDDDEPTEPSQYTENDDEDTTKSPDDDDDEPTEPSQYTENDDEDTTKSPDDDDDEPTDLSQYTADDVTPKPADNSDDDVPTLPLDKDNSLDKSDNTKDRKPDFGFARKESIELELPPKPGFAKGESFKIDVNETFIMTKLKDKDGVVEKYVPDDDVESRKQADRGSIS